MDKTRISSLNQQVDKFKRKSGESEKINRLLVRLILFSSFGHNLFWIVLRIYIFIYIQHVQMQDLRVGYYRVAKDLLSSREAERHIKNVEKLYSDIMTSLQAKDASEGILLILL